MSETGRSFEVSDGEFDRGVPAVVSVGFDTAFTVGVGVGVLVGMVAVGFDGGVVGVGVGVLVGVVAVGFGGGVAGVGHEGVVAPVGP